MYLVVWIYYSDEDNMPIFLQIYIRSDVYKKIKKK